MSSEDGFAIVTCKFEEPTGNRWHEVQGVVVELEFPKDTSHVLRKVGRLTDNRKS